MCDEGVQYRTYCKMSRVETKDVQYCTGTVGHIGSRIGCCACRVAQGAVPDPLAAMVKRGSQVEGPSARNIHYI